MTDEQDEQETWTCYRCEREMTGEPAWVLEVLGIKLCPECKQEWDKPIFKGADARED